MRYFEALDEAMYQCLKENPRALVIGQGVSDHKAIFGTVASAQKDFADRLIETPIAEESTAGICIGLALAGFYPVNTHIRSDFALLAFNQLINLAAKYKYMFGGLFQVPMLQRWVVGRSWGQGAQHSQSLQSLVGHIPGLVVIMPSSSENVLASYAAGYTQLESPLISLEHRLMYDMSFKEREGSLTNPLFGSQLVCSGNDCTVVATSIMVIEAQRAASYLAPFGISVEVIDLHSITHFDESLISRSAKKTRRLVVVDTSWARFGVCAEILAVAQKISQAENTSIKATALGMAPSPCPTAHSLEKFFYPDLADIIGSIMELVGVESDEIPIPEKEMATEVYKQFKGPF